MKKIISLMLVLILVLAMETIVFASNNGITVIIDNEDFRVVKEVKDEGVVFVKFNKKTGSIELTNINQEKITITNEKEQGLYSITSDIDGSKSVVYTRSSVLSQENTFMNFEYTKYTNGTWQLRRPDNSIFSTWNFLIRETSYNESDLEKYQDLVEDLNLLEYAYLGTSVLAGATTCLAIGEVIGTVGAATPAAILQAAGASGAMLVAGITMAEKGESCYEQYFEVFYDYQSDVIPQ